MIYNSGMIYLWCGPHGKADVLPPEYRAHQTTLQDFCDLYHEPNRAEVVVCIFEGPIVFFSMYRPVATYSNRDS